MENGVVTVLYFLCKRGCPFKSFHDFWDTLFFFLRQFPGRQINMISFKERVKNAAVSNAVPYKETFIDYEYLICSPAFQNGFHIIKSDKGNYLHPIDDGYVQHEFICGRQLKTQQNRMCFCHSGQSFYSRICSLRTPQIPLERQ